jgi:hypothetical protein
MRTLLIIAALSLPFSILADDPHSDQLLGHWRYTNVSANRVDDITFAADGTYTGRILQDGKLFWEFAGKWSLRGNTLSYEYTRSSLRRLPVGLKDRDRLLEVTKDYYVIQTLDDSKRRWLRVRER